MIADSQYSDSKLRSVVKVAVSPYPANQKCGVMRLLRVDKKFRTHRPEDQKREYHKKPHIEAVHSFLKTQYSMTINKVRSAKNVASYAIYNLLCLVLNREVAENIRRPTKLPPQPTSTPNKTTKQRVKNHRRRVHPGRGDKSLHLHTSELDEKREKGGSMRKAWPSHQPITFRVSNVCPLGIVVSVESSSHVLKTAFWSDNDGSWYVFM